jgi:hypothetical protein
MTDPLDTLLGLVASGRLTAEEAAPLIDALQGPATRAESGSGGADADADAGAHAARAAQGSTGGSTADRAQPKALRIEITEDGRKVVNLRVPISLGRMALDRVPGLSIDNVSRIVEALDQGLTGSLLEVNEGDANDGVRIILE